MLYQNRSHAGKVLAGLLHEFAKRTDVLILALPRGGVPVASEIARALKLPMDVFIVRKLGVPGHEELAMGAIATGGIRVLNQSVIKSLKIPTYMIDEVASAEQIELERRELSFRSNRPPHQLEGMEVILVDDGLATGATMRAAVRAVKTGNPRKVFIAAPVAERETIIEFRTEVDGIFCPATPYPFQGVGQWYKDFTQTSDEEVSDLLATTDAMTNAKTPHTIPEKISQTPPVAKRSNTYWTKK
jgi:putative phosphoribosyl transferase